MRVASSTIYRQVVAAMQQAQGELATAQQQLSSGQRITRAGEDPSAFSSASRMTARLSELAGYGRAGDRAEHRLSMAETRIAQGADLLGRVREIAVQGNNATLSESDRVALAGEVAQIREQLLQTANATDGEGRPLFAGTADGAAFTPDAGGVVRYSGNAGTRLVAINEGSTVADGERGTAVFGGDSANAFAAVDAVAAALAEPDPVARADGFAASLDALDARLEQLNLARGRIGARLSAIDRAGAVRDAENEQLTAARSALVDTDITRAVTDMAQAGNRLSATQQAYLQVQQQSLFDLIR
ncbi:flagellar hook-associated protein FlgL [Algiphilus sp.]|uniref:flagellar hook-associated protein FlgL n=1 Tax=Algiphilus sp. TaxID=1872431 RepID=UPI0025C1CF1A|nr:flagellar hook-associated protein FlgL [Algiphilus sp.]MCK5771365.1 flagellar hook-associated protein FlgL [Algiphilus sp.]